jgi:hypothetical protein
MTEAKKREQTQPAFEDVVRRMLNTKPAPRKTTPQRIPKKRAK